MKKSELGKAKKSIDKLLGLLEIEGDSEVTEAEEGADVVLDTEESGIVIGHHGETLDALQLIMSLVVAEDLGRFERITLEVGDYKKNREEWLKNLALSTKDRAVSENREIELPMLKPWERRIIHLMLQDDDQVTSESVGEGRERTLVIKPR